MAIKIAKIVGSGITHKEYSRQDCKRGDRAFSMSRSELMEFAHCPARWLAGCDDGGSKSTRWGTIMDVFYLTPHLKDELLAVWPALYIDDGGNPKPWNNNAKVCKAWNEAQGDRLLIKPTELLAAEQAVKRAPVLFSAATQVMVTADYEDEETGIVFPIRTLIDLVPDKANELFGKSLADFKTTASASPDKWRRSISEFSYDVQAALNLDLYCAATGEDRTDFLHIVQENESPYQSAVYLLSSEFIILGRAKYEAALKRYATCLQTNHWPGYETREQINGAFIIEPEPWMIEKAMIAN